MRRVWIGLLAALLTLGAVDSLAWYWATTRLAAGFAAWTQARRDAGWIVRSDPPRRAGWPLSAALVVPHLQVVATKPMPADPWPVAWRVQRLVLRVRPRVPLRLSLSTTGQQDLGPPGGPEIPYTASRLVLHLPLHDATVPRPADLAAQGLRIGPAARPVLTLGTLQLQATPPDPDAPGPPVLAFALSARDIVLPPGRRWPLGRRIASLAVHGTLDGPVPAAGSARQRAATWQRAGGQLVLHEAALRWGPLTASLEATLGLDPALQPEGQGRAMMSGYARALDTLAANGAVRNDTAVAAKAVLSLLAAARPGTADDTVTVPFILHDGTLRADGMPLLRLPPLAPAPAEAPPAGR